MIKEHVIDLPEKGETQAHIDICQYCPLPAKKCNGECERYKQEVKKLKNSHDFKRLKKTVIIY